MLNKKKYLNNGFAIINIFNKKEIDILNEFTKNWIYNLANIKKDERKKYPINKYHLWSKKLKIDHSHICNAKNRYFYPNQVIKKITKDNEKIKKFLFSINIKKYKIWDDGWGWLGFRLIRPGKNDGYPLSRKSWGIAENVISCWVPIIGTSPNDTLTIVKKSHLYDYDHYLPKNSKFTKGEYRLSKKYRNIKIYNPKIKHNEIIIYHPKTLHSESNKKLKNTRLNLEFRFKPSY